MTVKDLHERGTLPLRHTVCGVPLCPMTVGHARLLDALDLWSPENAGEVLLAAFVCSMPHADARRWMDRRAFGLLMRFWMWRLGSSWDWLASIRTWREYVTYHMEEPVVIRKPSTSTSQSEQCSGTPKLSHMRVVLCSRVGYRPETFDEQPMAQATLDYLTFLETEGLATVANFTRRQLAQIQTATE